MIHVFYTKRSQEEDYEFKENLVFKNFLMTLLSSKKKEKALLSEHHCLNSDCLAGLYNQVEGSRLLFLLQL